VYGPVRTVVWQGSAVDRRPYADQRPQVPLLRSWTCATRWRWIFAWGGVGSAGLAVLVRGGLGRRRLLCADCSFPVTWRSPLQAWGRAPRLGPRCPVGGLAGGVDALLAPTNWGLRLPVSFLRCCFALLSCPALLHCSLALLSCAALLRCSFALPFGTAHLPCSFALLICPALLRCSLVLVGYLLR
jgi:hypothetical protein